MPAPTSTSPLPLSLPITGERTVPGVAEENYWFQRHVVAYEWAAARCRDKTVVDAGSGEGYGVALLGKRSRRVTGIELLQPVTAHARASYPDHTFLTGDICDTRLPDNSVDVVVNLQVIEHLPDVPRFLGEVRRLLVPGGQLITATPNRLTFSPHADHGDDPVNVFHVQEFTAGELVALLEDVGGFGVEQVLGVHHGRRLRALEAMMARPLTEAVMTPPATWPRWLRTRVAQVTPADFEIARQEIDTSLDLLVVARPE